jgi:hypothetical protein
MIRTESSCTKANVSGQRPEKECPACINEQINPARGIIVPCGHVLQQAQLINKVKLCYLACMIKNIYIFVAHFTGKGDVRIKINV